MRVIQGNELGQLTGEIWDNVRRSLTSNGWVGVRSPGCILRNGAHEVVMKIDDTHVCLFLNSNSFFAPRSWGVPIGELQIGTYDKNGLRCWVSKVLEFCHDGPKILP